MSKKLPLRSVLLDPEANTIPRSKTRSELLRRRRFMDMPHDSYDIDGDGVVDQEDFRLAKLYDQDGNGLLDDVETEVGRLATISDFIEQHPDEAREVLGEEGARCWETGDMEGLSSKLDFKRNLKKMRGVKHDMSMSSSHRMKKSLQPYQNVKKLTPQWQVWQLAEKPGHETISPGDSLRSMIHDAHGGSAKAFHEIKHASLRHQTQERLAAITGPHLGRFGRVATITNMGTANDDIHG